MTFDHARALAELADSPHRDAVIDEEAELAEWAFDATGTSPPDLVPTRG